jgi:8-oxo-dGTP pyrophosphatase MutT (NUDIX family)
VSLHADALEVLTRWEPPTTAQATLRDRYVAHLAAHGDGVYRECRPDHLTASTVVLSPDRDRVLLTLHAKAGRWFQLGGHCEPGDPTLAAAALREATEESGLGDLRLDPVPVHLDEHAVPFCGPDGEAHHLDVRFVAVAGDEAGHAVSEESLDVAWWPVDALPDTDLHEVVALAVAQSTSSGGGSMWAAAE